MGRLNGLDLFSGIGGNTLALRQWVKTIAYCERDRYAQSVLISRMADESIERAPIWDDVTTLSGSMFDIPIDIIIAGFPCQDISLAGKGAGLAGQRSGLFFEIMRLAKKIKPTFLFLENVPAIRTRGLDRVIEELTEAGYDCRWCMLSAAEVGAIHKRQRWFLLGNANYKRQPTLPFNDEMEKLQKLSNTNSARLEVRQGQPSNNEAQQSPIIGTNWWAIEPNVGRVANGIPFRMDRIKCLGNAVVPKQAREAFKYLMGINDGTKPS